MVGALYCIVTYFLGFKSASFQRPITKDEFKKLFGPAAMHAIGHVAANLSFAAVAISLTHTVKTLEPAFNVVLSKLVLGTPTPWPVAITLVPVMVRRQLLSVVAAGSAFYSQLAEVSGLGLVLHLLSCCMHRKPHAHSIYCSI